MSRNEKALEIAKEIHELEAKLMPLKTRHRVLVEQFARLVPDGPVEPDADQLPEPTALINSIPARTIRYLRENSGVPFSAVTIARTLRVALPTMRATLMRLTNSNKIQRIARGIYCATPAAARP